MTATHIAILVGTGVLAGFAGGLLGLGGAFIMTPVQYAVYLSMGLSPDVATRTAFGTSLLAVLAAAVSAVWRHHREGLVHWRLSLTMGMATMVFALTGALLAGVVASFALRVTFGSLAILSAVRMILPLREQAGRQMETRKWVWLLLALPVGLLSGMLGVGGGVLMVPVLAWFVRLPIHQAVANSLAIMSLGSLGGIAGYIVSGLGAGGRLPWSVGYIHLLAWLLLALPAVATAQLGAAVSHRVQGRVLGYIFAVVIFYIGLRMTGLFDWLGSLL
ncbi:MAG: sulfite exporter TauE/SafE family protein [Dehalococcoidales bacterium]|nr:sulfite exporter TauE/SafE family protein [Dehalococcoidales bacterium]